MDREYVKIYCCGDCVYYDWKKHRCRRGAYVEGNNDESFYRDCPLGIFKEKEVPGLAAGKETEHNDDPGKI